MTVVQTRLVKRRNGRTDHMVAWLPVDSRVKVGTKLSLKELSGVWSVEEQYAIMDSENIQRNWVKTIAWSSIHVGKVRRYFEPYF